MHVTGSSGWTEDGRVIWYFPPWGIEARKFEYILSVLVAPTEVFELVRLKIEIYPGTSDFASKFEFILATIHPVHDPPEGKLDSWRAISKLWEDPMDLGLISPPTEINTIPEEFEAGEIILKTI